MWQRGKGTNGCLPRCQNQSSENEMQFKNCSGEMRFGLTHTTTALFALENYIHGTAGMSGG